MHMTNFNCVSYIQVPLLLLQLYVYNQVLSSVVAVTAGQVPLPFEFNVEPAPEGHLLSKINITLRCPMANWNSHIEMASSATLALHAKRTSPGINFSFSLQIL